MPFSTAQHNAAMDSPANRYHFRTEWSFSASIEEIAAILEDVESLSAWWPTVYLQVTVTDPGGEGGIGKRVDLLTKGYLPYRLRWNFTVTESDSPRGFTLEAEGDFVGRGVWILRQEGERANVGFDWRIRADKPLLRYLSFLMKPLFKWNHHWAMKQGEVSLEREIVRRRHESGQWNEPASHDNPTSNAVTVFEYVPA